MGYQETYLAKEHIRMGHNVLVIASNRYGKRRGASLESREAPTGLSTEYGIRVLRLPILFELPTEWADPWLKGLVPAIREFSPDIVHAHGILSFSNVRTALAKEKIGYGLVIDCHRAFFNVFHPHEGKIKRYLKVIYYKLAGMSLGRITVRKADAFVAIGDPEKEFTKWFFGPLAPDDIPIIHLGADHERFQFNAQAREQIRNEMGWREGDIVLGHAGTINQKKGIESLQTALGKLPHEQQSKIHLHLVGNITGQYEAFLDARHKELKLESELIISTFVPIDELARIMSAWDIGIWAGDISNTALEAMAVGLPIIASKTTYTESIIEKYDAGFLVERENIQELSAALSKLVSKNELRKQKAVNAREAIDNDLNWQKISTKFIELYENILSTREQPL